MSTYFLAWVDQSETTWGPQFLRDDEDIFDWEISQTEGNSATLTIQIENPNQGLLAPGRKFWAWLSWINPETNEGEPIFFGRVIALPTNILARVVTVILVGQPIDYLDRQQIVAEGLKQRPFYDPILLDPARRDDPNAILEGYSVLWHVDRITHEVTVSDILVGEDGVEVFFEDDFFYDSLDIKVGQAPLSAVNVDVTVKWTQKATGEIDIGTFAVNTYSSGMLNDWPKPLSSIGGGWTVHSSSSYDVFGNANASTFTRSDSWESHEKHHEIGDTIATSSSETLPASGNFQEVSIDLESTPGVLDPFNPDFVDLNTPSFNETLLFIPLWYIETTLVLRYDASRPRTEHLRFTLQVNLQEIMTPSQSPPLPPQETITLSGVDVGEPLTNVLDWLSVRGQSVSEGQVIYPDVPTVPGGTSFQICKQAGVCGLIEPDFSPVVGDLTNDGTVVWASLGESLDVQTPDWNRSTFYPVGSIIRPLAPNWAFWLIVVPPPRFVGTSISFGQIVKGSNGSYQYCLFPGTTGISEPPFVTSYGGLTQDGEVIWFSLGMTIPDGTVYYLAENNGVSNALTPPNFNPSPGATFSDNDITWKSLGTAGSFIQIPIVDQSRRSYFTTDRGLWTLENAICRGRSKLLLRSRCVRIELETTVERAVRLSCRKSAEIHDRRIPGGVAVGKITSYKIKFDGQRGVEYGSLVIECSVGFSQAISETDGDPTYCDVDYVDSDYQEYTDNIVALPASDVGYSVPLDAPNDDNLVFPLTRDQVVVRSQFWGSPALEFAFAVGPGIGTAVALERIAKTGFPAPPSLGNFTIESLIRQHAMWFDLELKPVTNGPFNSEYHILTTQLQTPKQIDLAASSNT